MPTYDYRCDACGHEIALFQSITAPVKRTCPKCRKRRFRRLIGAGAGIIFRGSGFYETDYKRKRGGGESGETKAAEASKPGKEGASKEGGSKDGASQGGASKGGASKEGGSKEGGSKEGGSKESAPAKPAEKKAAE